MNFPGNRVLSVFKYSSYLPSTCVLVLTWFCNVTLWCHASRSLFFEARFHADKIAEEGTQKKITETIKEKQR